jgi:hypothetical protein
VAVRKILIAIALLSLVATNAEARGGGWHGYGGGGRFFFYGALAALTFPFYYSQVWAGPGPYYYPSYPSYPSYSSYPSYPSTTVYVQSPPSYVVAEGQPRNVVTQSPGNGVVELGPISAVQPQSSNSGQLPAGRWFVYPSKGQSQEQQANDRTECNGWATSQSGYDPDLRSHRHPDTGPTDYGRALSACLEGRGYAIR